ncbi:hypothetical protein Micbo1qcDRAFT_231434 [Microdochium bolleyi]|uniref:2EXR domain-containing protein n=1 Tax=Microdochium bolleyi TaxID=196109 RepID=A0A136J9E0_9PEZI|nr:hypothetical protein Micbo1qcDRAFT_231434 [Microdochium bolleyi]
MFHVFSQLPYELRIRVWECTLEPRIVHLWVRSSCFTISHEERKAIAYKTLHDWRDWISIKHVSSKSPVPSILHVSREARSVGSRLYQKTHDKIHDRLPADAQYYAYVNWAIDIIALDDGPLASLINFRHKIQRLRILKDSSDDLWDRYEARGLRHFTSLQELFVVCENGIMGWHGVLTEYPSWCNDENVYLIEPDPGYSEDPDEIDYWDRPVVGLRRMVKAVNVDAYYKRIRRIMEEEGLSWAEVVGDAGRAFPFTGIEPTLEMVLAEPPVPGNKWKNRDVEA